MNVNASLMELYFFLAILLGGYMNPAITLAMMTTRQMSFLKGMRTCTKRAQLHPHAYYFCMTHAHLH